MQRYDDAKVWGPSVELRVYEGDDGRTVFYDPERPKHHHVVTNHAVYLDQWR